MKKWKKHVSHLIYYNVNATIYQVWFNCVWQQNYQSLQFDNMISFKHQQTSISMHHINKPVLVCTTSTNQY